MNSSLPPLSLIYPTSSSRAQPVASLHSGSSWGPSTSHHLHCCRLHSSCTNSNSDCVTAANWSPCFYPCTPCPPRPQYAFHPVLILSYCLLKTLQQLLVTPSKRHSTQGPTSLWMTSPPLPDLSPGPTSPGAPLTLSPEYLSVLPPPGLSNTCSSLCSEGPSPQGPHGLCFTSQSPMDRV